MELAKERMGARIAVITEADITREQAYDAAEILVFGTFFNIVPVVEYDGNRIGDGRPGPVFKRLLQLLAEDEVNNPQMLTPV